MSSDRIEPPLNVHLQFEDGRDVAVECVYIGFDLNGRHVWKATQTVAGFPTGLTADRIPPKTAILVEGFEEV